MTNFEAMDYTHSHPSIIASLFGTVHCPFSHRELMQTSPVHPNPVIWYALSHINLLISSSNSHHTYLLWHFHSHSEIYCRATFHRSIYMTHIIIVILLFAWSCSWHRICGKATMHIISYMSLLNHCTSRYTAGGIHIESYFCSKYLVVSK